MLLEVKTTACPKEEFAVKKSLGMVGYLNQQITTVGLFDANH